MTFPKLTPAKGYDPEKLRAEAIRILHKCCARCEGGKCVCKVPSEREAKKARSGG